VAGGLHGAHDRKPQVLTTRRRRLTPTLAACALCVALLTACTQSAASPTVAPAPTLVVVTATPGPPPVPTPGKQQRYVVQEGDTLSGIAARFGVSEEAILEENPLSNRDQLFVGQELIIPPAQP
jgi:LysM repeat protein